MAGALAGIRVIDISLTAAGAWTSRLLSDAGADVILVEPRTAHPLRGLEPRDASGVSLPAANLLANKRAVALDLDSPRSRRYAVDIIRKSDVVVASQPVEWLAERGMAYPAYAKQSLVMARVLPEDAPALDVEAHAAGSLAYTAVVAALCWRDGHPGEGDEIEILERDVRDWMPSAPSPGDPAPSSGDDASALWADDLERVRFWRRPASWPNGPDYPGPAFRMSATPAVFERRPPRAGEHTFNVLRTITNTTDDHLLALYESGVIGIEESEEAS